MDSKYSPEKLRRRNLFRFYFVFFTFAICSIFYYFGEIVDFFGWEVLRLSFFYGVHDIHRLIFLFPIIYTAYYFGMKPTIIITILAICMFIPRALFISPYPDPLIRTILFTAVAVAVGLLTARESKRRKRLEKYVEIANEQYFRVLEKVEAGVLLIGPDYRIRFLNDRAKQKFGEGIGSYCYNYLHKKDTPCQQICRLRSVQEGATAEMEYDFPDGMKYKVVVLPYVDTDGVVCQLSIIKNIINE